MAIPSKGQIAIFNRSHYEDVIEVRVHNLIPKNDLTLRYRQINDFERYLSENHVKILIFLHISKDEQKKDSYGGYRTQQNAGRYEKATFKT
jgi:polyphosphate kinase 2 (PPK2 family)